MMTFASLRAAKCWQTSLFSKILFLKLFHTSVLASLDLFGQLLSNKISLPAATSQPDATALTENTINSLNYPKNIKILFRTFPNFPKNLK